MELEQVDIAEGVLLVHDDVYLFRLIDERMSMRRYSAAALYTTIGLYWLFSIHCYSKIRDCKQQVGVVPATREVVVVVTHVLWQRRLR